MTHGVIRRYLSAARIALRASRGGLPGAKEATAGGGGGGGRRV